MTKRELIQLIKDGAGVDFGDRTVAKKIGMVFESVASQLFATNNNQWAYYSKTVTLPVVNRVAKLTIPLIQTKNNSNGVPMIQLTGAACSCEPDETVFYSTTSYGMNTSVDAAKVSTFVFYVVTANEIRFARTLPADVTEVSATVIPEFSAYSDDEFINLPSGAAQQIIDLCIAAVQGNAVNTNIYKKQ